MKFQYCTEKDIDSLFQHRDEATLVNLLDPAGTLHPFMPIFIFRLL